MKKGADYIGVGCGAMIFDNQGKVLLVKRGAKARNEPRCWNLPGGTVEYGEKMEQAVKREIKEELGISVKIFDVLGYHDQILKKEKQHWVSVCFLCKIARGVPKNMEPDKCEKIGWFAIGEIRKLGPKSVSLIKNLSLLNKRHGKI